MIKLFLRILFDEYGGLGITRASMVSAVCDKTGDDSTDATVKVKRLINEKGPEFCELGPFPFLHPDAPTSFDINAAGGYTYSGSGYLPTTFKRVVGAYLLDGSTRCPLDEVAIGEANQWDNPNDNTGRPDKFCITRIVSGYWEVAFNRKPDGTYTVYFDLELQWADLTEDTSETLITKRYYPQFVHFVSMDRFIQQGDAENYQIADLRWHDPRKPGKSMLDKLLASLSNPLRQKSVMVSKEACGQELPSVKSDYS